MPFFLSSLIKVYTVSLSQQSDQGLHDLPFFLSSINKIYTVCRSQQSDRGLYWLPFSAVWSGSTLYSILCSLIRVYTICHSLSDQGLQYLSFSEVWSSLFAILSKQYYQGLHCLPFLAVWSGLHCLPFSAGLSESALFAILSLISVYTICHSQQSDQCLHYLTFFLSSITKDYTVCRCQQTDQGLHYLSFSAVWSGSTLFAVFNLIRFYTYSCSVRVEVF